MKIIATSDLHIGAEDCNVNSLRKFLIEEAPKADVVILGGDVFDLWIGNLGSLISKNKKIVEAISRLKEVYWITGNHDSEAINLSPLIKKSITIQEKLVLTLSDNRKLIFTHGHEFDEELGKYYFWAKLGYQILNVFRRTWDFDLTDFHKSERYIKIVERHKEKSLETYNNYGIIMSGHTHVPYCEKHDELGGIYLINTGDWVESNSYVIIEDGKDPELITNYS